MGKINKQDYDNHKNAEVMDTIIAEDTEAQIYEGTVLATPGSVVKVVSEDRKSLEFRRIKDDTGFHIALGIDGKSEYTEDEIRKGLNENGDVVIHESGTISYDHEIIDFKCESQEVFIGE